MYGRISKIVISILLATVAFLQVAKGQDLKILALRVDFIADNHGGTTGNGKFLLSNQGNECGNYTVDPSPHDKSYFESQLTALDNYFRAVSKGHYGIDLENSDIYPTGSDNAYTMPDSMSFYNPFISDLSQDEFNTLHEVRIVELFSDAVKTAYQSDNIIFNQYDLVIVFHAGVSQDFAFDFDTTPEDIPSTYIDYQMISNNIGNEGIQVGDTYIKNGIILPETQNHILFPKMVDDLNQRGIQNVCNYQYGLTGTFAMLVGQAIGLPSLWNTDTGESGIGVFGLMDQGSNNGQGLIPAPPIAWNRNFLGWEEPENIIPNSVVEIESRPFGNTLKIDIDDDEYFLIENRTNWFRSNVDIDSVRRVVYNKSDTIPNIIEVIFDSVGVVRDDNGVVVSVPDYDIGIPGSGLLIWHIDESIISDNIQSNSINNDPKYKGIDLEEAGGPQDIGYISTALFRDPSIGEPFDMWYQSNPEYDGVNSNTKSDPLEFNSMTYPNTNSNLGALSNLNIGNIGFAFDTMRITISNDLILSGFPDTSMHILYHTDFNGDGKSEIIGGVDELWWSETGIINKNVFYELPSNENHFVLTNSDFEKSLVILSNLGDSLKMNWFILEEGFSNNRFVLNKEEILSNNWNWESVQFLTGQDQGNQVHQGYSTQNIFFGENAPGKPFNRAWFDSDGGIAIGEQLLALEEIEFKYISAIDLSLDGVIEILALDKNGILYGLNQNYTFVSGFPVDYDAVPPILGKNIIGDEKPEIIFKNKTGEVIILNDLGKLQYRLSGIKNSKLIMLGEHEERNTIVSESNIWIFDEISENRGNEWTSWYGDENNSTLIEINYSKNINNNEKLFDKKKTYVYPNPARNGKTKIRVFNYSADKINIKIYDAAGYFVDEIQSDIDKNSSIWETVWDVTNIESGVYLIKLTISNNKREESTILIVGVVH